MNAIIRAATGRRPALSADEPEDEGSDQDRTRQNLGAPPRDE